MMSKLFMSAAVAALICGLSGVSTAAHADPPAATREANLALANADREAVRLLSLLDQSRREHNLARIACVDDQLSRVNSFTRILTLRAARIRAALAQGATRDVIHERGVIRRVAANVRRAARAGRACVFPAAGQGDWTRVEVLVSPEIRQLDLTPPRQNRR